MHKELYASAEQDLYDVSGNGSGSGDAPLSVMTTPNDIDSSVGGQSGLSTGGIAGIAVGGVALVVLVTTLVTVIVVLR